MKTEVTCALGLGFGLYLQSQQILIKSNNISRVIEMPCLGSESKLNPLKSLSLRLVGSSVTSCATLELSPHFGREEAFHRKAPGEKTQQNVLSGWFYQ